MVQKAKSHKTAVKLPKNVAMQVEKNNLVVAINLLSKARQMSLSEAKTLVDAYEAQLKQRRKAQFSTQRKHKQSSNNKKDIKKNKVNDVRATLVQGAKHSKNKSDKPYDDNCLANPDSSELNANNQSSGLLTTIKSRLENKHYVEKNKNADGFANLRSGLQHAIESQGISKKAYPWWLRPLLILLTVSLMLAALAMLLHLT